MTGLGWAVASICLVAVLAAPPKLGTKEPYPPMAPPFYNLVENGEAVSSIVLRPDCTEVEDFAAEQLTAYVEQMSGARLESAAEPQAGRYPIYLGEAGKDVAAQLHSGELGPQG